MKTFKLLLTGLCLATFLQAQETNIHECKTLAELKLSKDFTEDIKFIDNVKSKMPLMYKVLTDMHWMNCNDSYEHFCELSNVYSSSTSYSALVDLAHEDEKLYKILVYSGRALNCNDKQSLSELKKFYK